MDVTLDDGFSGHTGPPYVLCYNAEDSIGRD
jgi:hypothetical protein